MTLMMWITTFTPVVDDADDVDDDLIGP